MKLTNGISLFNKKSSKGQKICKNDILDKNCNFSVPLIENEISNQKKNYFILRMKKVNQKVKAIVQVKNIEEEIDQIIIII